MIQSPHCIQKYVVLLIIVFSFSFQSHVLAANKTWDGGASTSNWGDANNWNINGVPASADSVLINHAWQTPASAFTVDLGGVERVITGGTLTITGNSPSINPTIQNGYFSTGGSATINAQNTTITAGIRGNSSSSLLGNLTLTDVIYNNTNYSWECRGKTWTITRGQITQNKFFTVKSAVSGSISGTVTITGATPGHQFDMIVIGEYADGSTRFATLNIEDTAVVKSLNAIYLGVTGGTGGYGRLNMNNSTLIATRDFVVDPKGKFTTESSVLEFRPASTYALSIRTNDPVLFDGEGLLVKAFPNANQTGEIEVAGLDMSASPTGFIGNYSWDELHIGQNSNSIVKLVDNYNNNGTAGTWTSEALYVDTLRIAANATLNLNSKKLYYSTLINDGSYTFTQSNGTVTQVAGNDSVEPGTLTSERPTLISLGARWYMNGDANRNATVAVEYRKTGGSPPWSQAQPMLHIKNELIAGGTSIQWTAPHLFAGSVLDLDEDTEYEVRLTLSDPDGVKQPDGSTLPSTQQTLTMQTRKVPVPASGGTERHVYPSGWGGIILTPNYSDIPSAYTAAQNGDTVKIHAGTYVASSGYVFDKQPPITSPITIVSAGDGEVILDGGGTATNLLYMSQAKHHIVQGLTLRNAYQMVVASDNSYASEGLAFKECKFDSVTGPTYYVGSYHFAFRSTSKLCKDLYLADNILIGPKTNWAATASPYPYGIVIAGQGHAVCYNKISGYRDGIDLGQLNPIPTNYDELNNAIDIYNNEISDCDDDGIQLDFGFHNVRCMRNYVHRTLMGISFQPLYAGPAYVYRNVFYNQASSPLKTNSWPAGILLFNNTIAPALSAASFGAFWQNSQFFNNLFMGVDGAKRVISHGTPLPTLAKVNYNGYHWHTTTSTGKIIWTQYVVGTTTITSQNSYTTFASFVSSTGFEANGVANLEPTDFNFYITPTGQPSDVETNLDLGLTSIAQSLNKGCILHNITDSYGGASPDLGAYEYGTPIPTYGPR